MNNQKIPTILHKILEIIEYSDDKDNFVKEFVENLEKEIKISIAKNQGKPQDEIIKTTTERIFDEYLDEIVPTLTENQKINLDEYLKTVGV